MVDQEWIAAFETGFPLEKPAVLLPWGKPINEVAHMSGGIWHSDRFYWRSASYLHGLNYPLASPNGMPRSSPFREISAYIGLTPEGLWSDKASLHGFDSVSEHLTHLIGKPTELTLQNKLGEKDMSWRIGKVYFYLSVIEQFALKCHLTVGIEE